MEPALRLLVPHRIPISVPPTASGGWDRRPAVVLGGAHQGPGSTVASWAGELSGIVVGLGQHATVTAQAALLRAIGYGVARGGPLVLVHTGAGGASLLHTLAREHPTLACVSLEVADTPMALQTARAFARRPQLGSTEVSVDAAGHASGLGWREERWPTGAPRLAAGERVVVTGGTGGLGSAVALHLARRLGLHPVLVDSAPAGSGPARAALARLRGAGVAFTHVVVDVTDGVALAAALGPCTRDRPVTAIVHCAGVISAGPVATLDVACLSRLSAPKVKGLQTLLSVLERRHLRVVLGFGSVLSHLPHPLVGAYAYANERLRRELQRAQQDAPGPRYLAVEWSVWDGAGMAHVSGATAQARRAGYAPIPLAEGLAAVERLLAWSGPSQYALVGASFPGLRACSGDGADAAGEAVSSTTRGAPEADRWGRRTPAPVRTP